MNRFLIVLTLAAVALAEVPSSSSSNSAVPQYAEARDTTYTSNTFGEQSGGGSFSSSSPVQYQSGHSFYNEPQALNFGASLGHNGLNVGGNSLLGNDLINTGLTIVLSLFAFSVLMQVHSIYQVYFK
jgi:hypothetical protein